MNKKEQVFYPWLKKLKVQLCAGSASSLSTWLDNYIKVSNAIIGTTIRMPRILEWAYDTLGLVPVVGLQTLLGLALAGYGVYKIRTGK